MLPLSLLLSSIICLKIPFLLAGTSLWQHLRQSALIIECIFMRLFTTHLNIDPIALKPVLRINKLTINLYGLKPSCIIPFTHALTVLDCIFKELTLLTIPMVRALKIHHNVVNTSIESNLAVSYTNLLCHALCCKRYVMLK